ncbi:MAG: histidine kinase [Hydrogenophaga sp.]|uniref:sensor histidine kinase n=1 Tax=Hydrogenophaga sp. TaxID=1904254 RepID=UPI00271D47BE|nr:histidine kinase [Hydrogenophaga sp.]MDO8887512.1 histidine kinase [Hydrogenophaga sp.]MDP1780707.1 histidine kinase [Hydrogenophaga sp.]MDP2075915.1 histidine kinase [Hydrogenophaga sp.]MDP2250368.1 histidine kinase [Hydrogenophaga sp.]MDP3109157.1 histidine kinase [Hydrogenophaga sp.]
MPPLNPATIARRALAAVVFNTVIALAITAVSGESFAVNMLYSQFIGLFIWGLIDGGRYVLHPSGWPGAMRMAALVVGAVLVAYPLGSASANLLMGRELLLGLNNFPRATLGFVLMSLSAGAFGAYYFTSREMLARARLAEEEAQRQATEARLRLLESQLEPHMLFNTLANLRALIGTDPVRAVTMLDRLNDFLRATLKASRADATAGHHTLADEFARLRDYLELMAVRMGPRLRYTLELPETLSHQSVPPLLLQPLVENCIRHGLEPNVDGGEVRVVARQGASGLELEVSDTGVGCEAEPAAGFGLSQVRERLTTAYPGQARLHWHSAPGAGTRALLTLPLHTP